MAYNKNTHEDTKIQIIHNYCYNIKNVNLLNARLFACV